MLYYNGVCDMGIEERFTLLNSLVLPNHAYWLQGFVRTLSLLVWHGRQFLISCTSSYPFRFKTPNIRRF
jgi:hypothetical protein